MTPEEVQHQVNLILHQLDESRRAGAVDLIKVIVATASVLLTIFVSLLPEDEVITYCGNKALFFLSVCTLLSLFVCIATGFYHLYYSLVGIFNSRFGEVRSVLDENESTDGLLQRINDRRVNVPWLYKHALRIVFLAFSFGIIFLCIFPFWAST
ncbi:hypothetical protein [Methylophaga sp.]|uniref:hypothetical protein n=1 Tax=Methylophaga sp. TaxID=2024840 RepID=UPI003F7159E8